MKMHAEQIRLWQANDLKQLIPLLSASYGEPVSFEDEWEYFQSLQPQHWWVAWQDQKAVAYLRDFEYAPGAYELEFACEETDRWRLLALILKPFLAHHPVQNFQNGAQAHSLRFCCLLNQKEAQNSVKSQGFVREERFLYLKYQHGQQCFAVGSTGAHVRFYESHEKLAEVQACLACFGNIKPHSLRQAAQEQRLVVLEMNAKIIGASFQLSHLESIEILQLAILPEWRGKGFGQILAQGLCQLYGQHLPQHAIVLKVKDSNAPAIQVYKQCGFIEHTDAHEVWLYKDYRQNE